MKIYLFAVIMFLLPVLVNASENSAPKYMWYRNLPNEEKDYYAAFRGQYNLSSESDCEVQIFGASWFTGWIDGKYFCEGPARFPAAYPEYQTYKIHLTAGNHIIAVQVAQIGEVTRMLDNPAPFFYCVIKNDGNEILVNWKCERLEGYESQVRRINPQLGYIEWCDTRKVPDRWKDISFDDSKWQEPVSVERKLGKLLPLATDNPHSNVQSLQATCSGKFINTYGYEKDDPAARFFLCDLEPKNTPPDGVWRRYDLGRVRLMRPGFILDLPRGAVVEFAYSESLTGDRVSPWINLSAGTSCNLDHYIARGGEQEFFPLTPKGGRYIEVHIYAPPEKVHFIKEEILERTYFAKPEGSFQTNDTLLNKIWTVGVQTLNACSEDALIDNPTRERGEWTGDVVSVGMDITGAAYSDLRLLKRGLIQSAECSNTDGLVAGLSPGGVAYLSTYAAQWITACVHYWELTGDLILLSDLFSYAEKNIEAFEKQATVDGISDSLGWAFVDWGYVRNPGPTDMGVNLYYLAALRDMIRWCNAIDKKDMADHYQALAEKMTVIINNYYISEIKNGGEYWKRIGYHRAVLGLKLGFFNTNQKSECIEYIKEHILRCFPNDTTAPRLSNPDVNNSRLITPYFGHYAMPVLIEHGQMNFVLNQYRKCWGWMLEDDRTTWLEVFDVRWSHCHQWAGCPTWQMSRYLLGLQPRYDFGEKHFAFVLNPGSLKNSLGSMPISSGAGVIKVKWTREADGLHYHLETPVPIYLHFDEKLYGQKKTVIRVEKEFETIFKNL
jgi:hypothetical protein